VVVERAAPAGAALRWPWYIGRATPAIAGPRALRRRDRRTAGHLDRHLSGNPARGEAPRWRAVALHRAPSDQARPPDGAAAGSAGAPVPLRRSCSARGALPGSARLPPPTCGCGNDKSRRALPHVSVPLLGVSSPPRLHAGARRALASGGLARRLRWTAAPALAGGAFEGALAIARLPRPPTWFPTDRAAGLRPFRPGLAALRLSSSIKMSGPRATLRRPLGGVDRPVVKRPSPRSLEIRPGTLETGDNHRRAARRPPASPRRARRRTAAASAAGGPPGPPTCRSTSRPGCRAAGSPAGGRRRRRGRRRPRW